MAEPMTLDAARVVLAHFPKWEVENAMRLYLLCNRPGFLDELRAGVMEEYGFSDAQADAAVTAFQVLIRSRAH